MLAFISAPERIEVYKVYLKNLGGSEKVRLRKARLQGLVYWSFTTKHKKCRSSSKNLQKIS
jgi:hypothetical protein